MKRTSIRTQELSAEMQQKMLQARAAVANLTPRFLRCPYCQHNAIVVFEDTQGHVETKCKKCGNITVFHVTCARRFRAILH